MPVRSLNSSVLKWPDRSTVDRAVRTWAQETVSQHPELVKLGYFGSYARGDWGVGSDLDLVAIVDRCSECFERRPLNWDLSALRVPAELLVYTAVEWESLLQHERRFARTVEREAVWVYKAASLKDE
jgi:predicted nucleotidyltransferase